MISREAHEALEQRWRQERAELFREIQCLRRDLEYPQSTPSVASHRHSSVTPLSGSATPDVSSPFSQMQERTERGMQVLTGHSQGRVPMAAEGATPSQTVQPSASPLRCDECQRQKLHHQMELQSLQFKWETHCAELESEVRSLRLGKKQAKQQALCEVAVERNAVQQALQTELNLTKQRNEHLERQAAELQAQNALLSQESISLQSQLREKSLLLQYAAAQQNECKIALLALSAKRRTLEAC